VFFYLYHLAENGEWTAIFNVFRYVTFRAAGAGVTAFLIAVLLGPRVIRYLREHGLQDDGRKADAPDLDELHRRKGLTPTMGGVLILAGILGALLLWARTSNFYIHLAVILLVACGALGMVDDSTKLRSGTGRGLSIKAKLAAQICLGLMVAFALYFGGDEQYAAFTMPFLKPAFFSPTLPLVVFALFVVIVIVGTSNAVNFADGLDGLATGCMIPVVLTYASLAYVAGHVEFAKYLQIPYIPGSEELVVLCTAMGGAALGFLWFNSHPAEVFMGDTGSLPLGAVTGYVALVVKQELLFVVVGGIFVAEAFSVLLQIVSFRFFGRRVFRRAPIHHHFQVLGWRENKIVVRFWIVAIILAIFSLCTLKIR